MLLATSLSLWQLQEGKVYPGSQRKSAVHRGSRRDGSWSQYIRSQEERDYGPRNGLAYQRTLKQFSGKAAELGMVAQTYESTHELETGR